MEQQYLQQLMDKVLTGRATAQEQAELDEWYAAQGEEGTDLTSQLDEQQQNALGKKLFQQIEQQVQPAPQTAAGTPVRELPVRSNARWLIAAAVVTLLAVGGFYVFSNRKPAEVVIAAVWKAYTATNEVVNVRLPDRSTVWINAGSSIRFDSNFVNGKREIWLQGEAYFDVAHLEGKAFEVHTGRITTRVLGTAFNIDAYNPADKISVTVKRGKVAVSDSTRQLDVLTPDQRITCLADGSFKKDSTVSGDYMAWAGGQLVFRDMPFSEVAKRLERKFNIELIFKDPRIGQCSITASFETTTALKDILDMLALINGSEIQKGENPNMYYVYGKKLCK